jgi:hypothetical protein
MPGAVQSAVPFAKSRQTEVIHADGFQFLDIFGRRNKSQHQFPSFIGLTIFFQLFTISGFACATALKYSTILWCGYNANRSYTHDIVPGSVTPAQNTPQPKRR